MQPPPHIRYMIRRDMPDVLAIEHASSEHAWTEEQFLAVLRNRNVIGLVVEDRSARTVGFAIYELLKSRLHLHNLTVAPDRRGEGFGRAMVAKLLGKLVPHRRNRITLRVRETNLDAHLFLKATGFHATAVLRGHFDDTGEDAYAFRQGIPAGALAECMDFAMEGGE